MRTVTIPVLIAAALVTASCGALLGLNTITSRFADPNGDATAPVGTTAYDILEVVTNRLDNPVGGGYDILEVIITFVQTVVLPAPGTAPNTTGTELGNLIHIDSDRNPATGGVNSICGLEGLDFIVNGNTTRLANGNFRVENASTGTVTGEATPSVSGASGNVLTVRISLSALGGDDGETNLAELAAQNTVGATNFTDCAPGDPVAGTGGAVVTTEPGSRGLKSR